MNSCRIVESGVLIDKIQYSNDPSDFSFRIKSEPLFSVAQTFLSDPPPFDRFGLFLLKNSSKEEDLGMYSMYTGEGDPYTLSNIQSFNGNDKLKFWNSSDCNRVHGSDGASFNPYIKKVRS